MSNMIEWNFLPGPIAASVSQHKLHTALANISDKVHQACLLSLANAGVNTVIHS